MGQAFSLIGNAAGTTNRVGGVLGGYLASNRAARAQGRASRETKDYVTNQQNEALGYLDPYASTGEYASSALGGLLTGHQYDPTTGQMTTLNPEQRLGLFQASPGYQFRINEAQKAIQNSQAARGNLLSGGALKELSQYNQGLASDEYNNYISQLSNLASSGQNAASNQAGLRMGNLGNLANLYRGGLNSTYQGQKWQNFSTGFQQAQEYLAQNHENAGQSLSQMFGGGGMGGGMGGMMGG